MIFCYSTRTKNEKFKNSLLSSAKNKNLTIIEHVNDGEYSLTELYNKSLLDSPDDEIIIFGHDDIELEFGWDEKILEAFSNTNYGVIGVAGSASLNRSAIWWENRVDLCGIVSHEKEEKGKRITYDSRFSDKHKEILPVVVIDGVFIAVKKDRLKTNFNENIKGFHFYDISFSLENYLKGVNIGVITSFKIHHKSVGKLTQSWHLNKSTFMYHYGDYLPLSISPSKPINALCKQIETKNIKETTVGVIILTKDKIEYVIECIKSLIENTDNKILLKIVIGDTGSSKESLVKLNNFIKDYNNVIIHDITKYNFAKNNNEIYNLYFKNDPKVELILLCNNDIKLINNALDGMVEIYQENKEECGTIGCRLLYENGRIQHGGLLLYQQNNSFSGATHRGLKSYYIGETETIKDVCGCTGAFLLISSELYKSVNGLKESTIECFEDVILNLEMILKNKINFYSGKSSCYHYESLTRNEDPNQNARIMYDFNQTLKPFIQTNFNKLKKYIYSI